MKRTLGLAGAVALALVAADPAKAQALPSFADIVWGSVELAPSGHEMYARFQPSVVARGMTLAEAAAYGGFDHFNWIQYATSYPGHATPFRDPPPGGFGFQLADTLPYYWDEVTGFGLQERFNVAANQDDFGATFSDLPGNFLATPSNHMSFLTALVGVYHPVGYTGPDTDLWEPLYVFSWSSDWNHFTGEVFIPVVTRNLDDSPEGDGGVFDPQVLSIDQVPPEVRALWRQDGGVFASAVPEPATWALAIGGFVLVGGALRRHQGSRQKLAGR